MIFGQTYYSIQEDEGVHVVRRHYWDDHTFDHQMEKEGNTYLDKSVAQRQADDLNKNKKKLYKHCPNCGYHTRNDDGICMDCKKSFGN